jgi:hypothetical protein
MLLQSGWTDDLFPPEQSLRVYNATRASGGYAALQFGDFGYSRGSNKVNADQAFNDSTSRDPSPFSFTATGTSSPPATRSSSSWSGATPRTTGRTGTFSIDVSNPTVTLTTT